MSAPGKHCRNCGVALPYRPTVARGLDRRTLCRSCHRIKQSKLAYASRKKREAPRPFRLGEAQHLVMAGAANRVRADNTLNRGKCKRRCPDCARLYCPDCLEAPCPACGNHLTDNPLEVSRVQAA